MVHGGIGFATVFARELEIQVAPVHRDRLGGRGGISALPRSMHLAGTGGSPIVAAARKGGLMCSTREIRQPKTLLSVAVGVS
jgi:hypothetical protein